MEGLFILDKFDSGAMEETILAASPGAGWDMAEASAQCSQVHLGAASCNKAFGHTIQ